MRAPSALGFGRLASRALAEVLELGAGALREVEVLVALALEVLDHLGVGHGGD